MPCDVHVVMSCVWFSCLVTLHIGPDAVLAGPDVSFQARQHAPNRDAPLYCSWSVLAGPPLARAPGVSGRAAGGGGGGQERERVLLPARARHRNRQGPAGAACCGAHPLLEIRGLCHTAGKGWYWRPVVLALSRPVTVVWPTRGSSLLWQWHDLPIAKPSWFNVTLVVRSRASSSSSRTRAAMQDGEPLHDAAAWLTSRGGAGDVWRHGVGERQRDAVRRHTGQAGPATHGARRHGRVACIVHERLQ